MTHFQSEEKKQFTEAGMLTEAASLAQGKLLAVGFECLYITRTSKEAEY